MNTWDISKITDMGHMLRCSMGRGFPSDFNQDISLWDVSHVTDMNNMLGGCSVFNRDLSQWDVSKVGAANGLFSGCNEFNADISKWNPASATNWEFLLNDATAFNQDLSGWKFPDGYRHWRNFFRNAKNMDKSRMPAGVTNDGLPGCCSCPPHDPVSNPWPESVAEYMEAKAAAAAAAEAAEAKNFGDCQAICAAEHECCNNDIKQGSSQKLSCLQACVMVKGGVTEDACNAECPKATCNFQVGGESYPACTVCDDVPAHKNHFGDKFKPADYTCSAHYGTHADGCKKGCAAGTTDFDTYKAEKEAAEKAEADAKAAGTWKRTGFETKTDVTNAVKECQKTNFAGDDCVMNWWDVSKITDMSFMLDCNQRRGFDREFNQDISKWDVSHVTDMRHMIQDCYLFNQDLSNWDMSNVQDARFMFNGAKAFKSDLSKWNPASATNWMGMFQLTDNFKSDLSGWKFPDGYNEYKNFFFRATAFHKALAPPQVLANPQDRTFNECCTCPDPIATPSPTIPAATVPTRTGFNHKNDVINAVKDCQNKGWEGDT